MYIAAALLHRHGGYGILDATPARADNCCTITVYPRNWNVTQIHHPVSSSILGLSTTRWATLLTFSTFELHLI